MSEIKPKVRQDLSLNPIQHEGQQMIVVQDPFGIVEGTLCLTEIATLLLSLMDGTRTISQIQAVFESVAGNRIPEDFARKQYLEVERLGLLETETYHRRKREVIEEYTACPTREASHASEAYDNDPESLRSWIDLVLDDCQDPVPIQEDSPKVLVAPHIDFRVNETIYGKAYRELRTREYDRVVLMGTGHCMLEGLYCFSHKDFISPLGTTIADRGAVEKLRAAADGVASPDDFPHRKEHALEFQLIFLQHLLGAENF